jgi:hypothetical protein
VCGLEVPDLFDAIRQRWDADEVLIAPINKTDTVEAILHFNQAVGLREPVLVDLPGQDPSCWSIPDADATLYDHFDARVPRTFYDPPFPLQFVVDGEGDIVWITRVYQPDELLSVLAGLIDG